jgi:hypothetical protein
MKKIQNVPVYSGKWFWLSIIAHVAVAGETLSRALHLQKRV